MIPSMLPPLLPLEPKKLSTKHKLAILVYLITFFVLWGSLFEPWYCMLGACLLHLGSYAAVLYTLFESFAQEEKETLADENNNNG